MTTQAVDALRGIHERVERLVTTLGPEDWSRPSLCTGWRVQDVFAHMSSNMKETVDPTPPPAEGAPDLPAEVAMEALVEPRRDWTPQQLLDEYSQYYEGWLAAMAAMQDEPMASTEAPLADLGTHPLHLVANAFAFDHYCHLYIDVLAPQGVSDQVHADHLIDGGDREPRRRLVDVDHRPHRAGREVRRLLAVEQGQDHLPAIRRVVGARVDQSPGQLDQDRDRGRVVIGAPVGVLAVAGHPQVVVVRRDEHGALVGDRVLRTLQLRVARRTRREVFTDAALSHDADARALKRVKVEPCSMPLARSSRRRRCGEILAIIRAEV